MKLRDYRKYTYKICRAWVANPSIKNTNLLVNNLTRWSKGEGDPYDYLDTATGASVDYCADRMNPGRAKAILKNLTKKD